VSRSKTSRGNGPATALPPQTTTSAPARSTSASTASRTGRLPWMSYRAAIRTARRLSRERQARTGADEVECRTARAGELARRRAKVSPPNPRDRLGKLPFEHGDVGRGERGGDDLVGALEELVGDLDLLRAVAQARKGVDEPLQTVLGLCDRRGIRAVEGIRLVVHDERMGPVAPE